MDIIRGVDDVKIMVMVVCFADRTAGLDAVKSYLMSLEVTRCAQCMFVVIWPGAYFLCVELPPVV